MDSQPQRRVLRQIGLRWRLRRESREGKAGGAGAGSVEARLYDSAKPAYLIASPIGPNGGEELYEQKAVALVLWNSGRS